MVKSGTVGDRFGQWFWITITAPGEEALPWDPGACKHPAEVACSGKLGCVVDAFDAAVWNGFAPRRWSWFMTYLRRRIGENAQYCGVWEYQARGVLHRHFLLRVEKPTTEKRIRAAVRGASRKWGFGSQYDVQTITGDCARQVWYVAKYSAKTADAVDGRLTLNPTTGELRETRGFRPWSASRSWGDSMRDVRQRQCAFARGGGGAVVAAATRPAAAGGAVGVALDPNSGISTLDPSGAVDLPRFSAPSVLL